MKTHQILIKGVADCASALAPLRALQPDLVLVFGAVEFFSTNHLATLLAELVPAAVVAGCSTAGEIAVDRVYDHTCVVTAINFAHTPLACCSTLIAGMSDSGGAGQRLAALLPHQDLSAVLLLGTGVAINGSALVAGLQAGLPGGVSISGGLAADGGAFKQTWTLGPDGSADNRIVAVGLYGEHVRTAYGSSAGWQPFGPARKVTRCADNVLYELDGKRALDIYKAYLGDYARDLPGSGLLFPFEMLGAEHQKSGIFRTILGINEEDGSLTLAGDIDPDGYLKLMHSSTEKLIEGAETAASIAASAIHPDSGDSLAILISCVGRKLVMGERIDEEVEAVAALMRANSTVTGFYSNGEIAASEFHGDCRLHNQTMTITWLSEAGQ
ncbi:hypothetical protein RCH09_003278 [Actimicrobium sp. GrIS 1.19]|uniref:FIST signal transduction protein n=1 Tax=Actimicrobium sp. GrIS 1.19 TaxID=3071708 RepID=UPI002DFE24FB|nr:hypothetical protein [Actimicrobium sp. GrIS 1.19]